MARPDTRRKSRSLWPLLTRAAIVVGGLSLLLGRSRPLLEPSAPDEAGHAGQSDEASRVAPADTAQHDSGRGHPATPPSAKARDQGHETEDMSGGLMARLALLLGTVACVVVLGMVEARTWLRSSYVSGQPALTALQTAPITPPDPRLQANPVQEIDRLRAKEDALLHGYAWVDPARTRARIPIDRAMALVVGRGLEHAQ